MLKIEFTEVHGFDTAIRGMRNALESWAKSDSYWTHIEDPETLQTAKFEYFVGDNDLALMKKLAAAGADHGKYLRYIDVSMDVVAPLYWWKETETYRIAVVENPSDIEFNSCSTMHKIHAKEFTLSDFSHEHLYPTSLSQLRDTIEHLNIAREVYLNYEKYADDWMLDNVKPPIKDFWWQLIQLLPSSYNQRRTVKLNYQVLKNMYHARKAHKLDEWREFCKWIESLPYSELITG